MFDKFKVLGSKALAYCALPECAHVINWFPVFTIKQFESLDLQTPGVRLVGGGNNIRSKGRGKAGQVVGRQDVIETSSPESVRRVIGVGKLRRLVCKQEDADGAYLQTPRNAARRPQGLYARIPKEFWPERV